MKMILRGMVALGLALAIGGVAPAGHRHMVQHTGRAYHETHGVRFSHGYCFHGPEWHQFTYRCWSPRFGCYVYWYPGTECWYYWSGPQAIYYPLNYATVLPPVGEAPPGPESLPNQLPPDLPRPG
jgi:hypothetical protein